MNDLSELRLIIELIYSDTLITGMITTAVVFGALAVIAWARNK